jgi:hypothetical protein
MAAAEILPPVPHPAPLPGPIFVTPNGEVILPFSPTKVAVERLRAGLQIEAWYPAPELDGTLLVFAAGDSGKRLTTIAHRSALRAAILDLQSIEAQLDALG